MPRTCTYRFTNFEDKHWFDACIKRVTSQHIGEEYVDQLDAEPYFVDFMRDAPEPTGEEGDDADLDAPKVYEAVRSRIKYILHVLCSFSCVHDACVLFFFVCLVLLAALLSVFIINLLANCLLCTS